MIIRIVWFPPVEPDEIAQGGNVDTDSSPMVYKNTQRNDKGHIRYALGAKL